MTTVNTITISFKNGEPDGLKTVEVGIYKIKAIIIPRNKLKEIQDYSECKKPSVYFLLGPASEEGNLPYVYIGETENLATRLSTHASDSEKDWWQETIAFCSEGDFLTKGRVKYLESLCLKKAKEADRFILNGAKNTESTVPKADVADMDVFFNILNLVLTTLRYPIFQNITSKDATNNTTDPLFTCKGKGAVAEGRYTSEGFVVYKGSTATKNINISDGRVKNRIEHVITNLKSNKYLSENEKDDSLWVFTKDYIFNSPSAASDVILGNSTNGWDRWKNEKNQTLNDIYS